jgi:hypothetical protein
MAIPSGCMTYQVDAGLSQILESTSVLKEVGAALSIGAGGNKILRRFDIHLDQEGGIIPENMAIWTMDGNKITEHPTPSSLQYGDQFVSARHCGLAHFIISMTCLGVHSSS